ncbi:hypothetical protein NKI16_33545 [Mesorhizobium sp. M0698]
MTTFDFRPTLNAPDDDPYLWLEDVEGERALDWAAGQSATTLVHFGGTQRERDRDALTAIFDRPDRIPLIRRSGQYLYNFWQDAPNPRGLWRRTTLAAYVKADPQWELLLDVDALAASDGEDWVGGGASIEPERRERAVLRLSRGGSEAVVHREFDLESFSFVADGFNLAETKGGVNWLDPDTLLLSSALGDGMATRCGYARTVRLWKRGADPLTGPLIFETGPESLGVSCHLDRTAESERLWFIEQATFFEKIGRIGDRSGPKMRIDLPQDASWSGFGDRLAVKPRKPWTVGGTTHAADALIGISLSSFIAGERSFATLFEPGDRRSLQSFFWNNGKLIISYLVYLVPRFDMFTPDRQEWTRRVLDTAPAEGTVHLRSLDAEHHETNGEVLVPAQDPITEASPIRPQCRGASRRSSNPEAQPGEFRRIRAGGHAPRGSLDRWGGDPLHAGRSGERERGCPVSPHRLRRVRHIAPAPLQLLARQAVARTRRHVRGGEHPGRRRVRHPLARGRAQRSNQWVQTIASTARIMFARSHSNCAERSANLTQFEQIFRNSVHIF